MAITFDVLKHLAEEKGYRFIDETDGRERQAQLIRPDGTVAVTARQRLTTAERRTAEDSR